MKKLLLFFFTFLLPMIANADDSGSCGDNVTWTFDKSIHKLTISGSGPMDNYGQSIESGAVLYPRPWESHLNDIHVVEIYEGVTSIGINSFGQCENLTSVIIPNTIVNIDRYAFHECSVSFPNFG